MKISYRTHSIIHQIERAIFDFRIEDKDHEKIRELRLSQTFKSLAPRFNNIQILTKPFQEAISLCVGKIWKSEITSFTHSGSGTFMLKDAGQIHSYCYDLEIIRGAIEKVTMLYFQGETLAVAINQQGDKVLQEYAADWTLIGENGVALTPEERIKMQLSFLFDFYLFTKYAELETKELKPKSKVVGVECKYVNDTSANIKILDSTWFTNLVKSDGFNVRGHFRLQPCGEGMKDRKIVWINDFKKTGYTAPARKLKEAI